MKLPVMHDEAQNDLGSQTALSGLSAPPAHELPIFGDEPGARECVPVLHACVNALRQRAASDDPTQVLVVPIDTLSPQAHRFLDTTLGVGEVQINVGGSHRYEAKETILPGLWRVTTFDGDDAVSRHLEVGDVPGVVRAANEIATLPQVSIGTPPPGAMNALPVLAELRHRGPEWKRGMPNHVMSFTLLPMSETDMSWLEQQLGHGPVRGESKGFSRCRVELTAVRNVWSVKHFNAMDRLILDTLEVGDVPTALAAGGHDFEDSATRLEEWLAGTVS